MQGPNFFDVLRRMDEHETHPFAVPAGWKPSTFDRGDLMRHVRVVAIVADLVDTGLGYDFARFIFVRHALLPDQPAFFRDLDWPDSDIAMATACFRLFTFRPDPLFNVPCLCSCITFLTLLCCFAEAIGSPPLPAE
jgi:hypothetical protein